MQTTIQLRALGRPDAIINLRRVRRSYHISGDFDIEIGFNTRDQESRWEASRVDPPRQIDEVDLALNANVDRV